MGALPLTSTSYTRKGRWKGRDNGIARSDPDGLGALGSAAVSRSVPALPELIREKPLATRGNNSTRYKVAPGNHIVTIPLQNQPRAFEPQCQPARIRVNDRAPVTIHTTGLSPVEICVASSKAPAITTVTNPLESIINTVTGLKGFDFETSSQNLIVMLGEAGQLIGPRILAPPSPPPANANPALALFIKLAATLNDTAKPVFDKQLYWQGQYSADLTTMSQYLQADYRKGRYLQFHPADDPILATVRAHSTLTSLPAHAATPTNPSLDTAPNEVDYAALQALVDQLKTLQTALITTCATGGATQCDPNALRRTAEVVERGSALIAVATDNLKALQNAQAAVSTAFAALQKVYADYRQRVTGHLINIQNGELTQDIVLGPDYGATDSGTISCSTDTSPAQPTTDSINYSILFQNVPAFTVSAGLLTTFLGKREIGTTTKLNPDGTSSTYFAITDFARASVFPMAYVNYRILRPLLTAWPGQRENELQITNSLSAGIGVNPNTGTNQVEFFAGDAIGFGRALLHFGAHIGRTENLGGGFQLNTQVPSMYSAAPPINWGYHATFSIGLSVRIAPF